MFEWLAAAAGWEANTQGMIERLSQGLRDNIHRQILSWDMEPAMMNNWQKACYAIT